MALKEYFPYSQVFHALSARATKDHRFLEQKTALQLAAVYAADRAILKQVLSTDNLVVGKSLPPFIQVVPSTNSSSERYLFEKEVRFDDAYSVPPVGAAPAEEAPIMEEQDLTQARTSDAGTLNFQQRAQQLQPAADTAHAGIDSSIVNSNEDIHIIEEEKVNAPNETLNSALDQPGTDEGATAHADAAPSSVHAKDVSPGGDVAAAPSDSVNVADQVLSDLERLNQLKHNFEALFEANKASILLRDAAKTVGVTADDEINTIQKARQKRIAELVSSLDPELNAVGELDYGTPSKNILEEIKNSKQALEPENDRQKDQLRLIDDFIKTQPSLTGKDKLPSEPQDLASIKTGEFSDNIVSETLVDILIKQGKRDKAVEVLKKLIWKFPQKKAYFAAQIEDLKK